MKIERSALVPFSAGQMFDLVHEFERYPEFLSWCEAANLVEEGAGFQVGQLSVSLAGLSRTFATRNTFERGRRLDMSLVEGPFRSLHGSWEFTDLGVDGSKIRLSMDFEFGPGLVSAAFSRGFSGIADRLVRDFCDRACQVYQQGHKANE